MFRTSSVRALSLGSVRPDRRFDAVDLATAESLGQRAGLAIDNARLYAAEQRVAVLSKYFAGLAVLISCLGLFGLAAFTAERRLKEIGVRKVLGAS